jgi:adenosine 3'-phospho 5'-phosphosulfate transporter B2
MEAGIITLGVFIFSYFSKGKVGVDDKSTSVVGIIFLLMYIFSDSFTSQWQSKVYEKYGKKNCDQYQMMLGVNCFAIIFTVVGLITSGDIPVVMEFMKANPVVIQYNIVTAITSATGQLFIFYTIKEFGPIPFTIIMTTRQMLSICISAAVFGHHISSEGLAGAAMVFGVIFYQIKSKLAAKKERIDGGAAK